MEEILNGQDIENIRTLGSRYDGNCVEVLVPTGTPYEYKLYRLPCSTIVQMVNEFTFELEKKRVHTHLVRAIPKDSVYEDYVQEKIVGEPRLTTDEGGAVTWEE